MEQPPGRHAAAETTAGALRGEAQHLARGALSVGLVLTLLGAILAHASMFLDRTGARSQGAVLDEISFSRGGSSVMVRFAPPGGAAVTFEQSLPLLGSLLGTTPRPPDRVAVAYDPERPEHARVPGLSPYWPSVLLVVGITLLAVSIFRLLAVLVTRPGRQGRGRATTAS